MRKEAILIMMMIGVVLSLIVIVAGGIVVKGVIKDIPGNDRTISKNQEAVYKIDDKKEMPFCGDEMIFFTTGPISMNDCSHIVPLGDLNPPLNVFPSNKINYFLKKEINNSVVTRKVPVVAPGHAWITEISRDSGPSGSDYSLTLTPCQDLNFVIEHIKTLDSEFQDLVLEFDNCSFYETAGYEHEICTRKVFVEVFESQVLGSTGGLPGEHSLDLTAYDKRLKNMEVISDYRFNFNKYGVPTCPLYYFIFESRVKMESKLGKLDNGTFIQRVEFPFCGKIYQDYLGTLQGVWFLKGISNSQPEDPHVALVHDNVEPGTGVFSIGSSFDNIEPGKYSFEPDYRKEKNQDFKVTTKGVTYCYELIDKNNRGFSVIVKLIDDLNMMMEVRESNLCQGNEEFSLNAINFVR